MARFIPGCDRGQSTMFLALFDDYVGEDNAVRAIDVFIEGLDLGGLGFSGVELGLLLAGYEPVDTYAVATTHCVFICFQNEAGVQPRLPISLALNPREC